MTPKNDPSASPADQPAPALRPPSSPSSRSTIVVNGRAHVFDGARIDRQQLASLAFPEISKGGEQALTVSYSGGPAAAPSGLLIQGRSVAVENRQNFNVTLTSKS